MAVTYDQSKLLEQAVETAMQWHPLLKTLGIRVGVLEASNYSKKGINRPALKDRRRNVVAKTKIIPLERRVLGEDDALIVVDRTMWQDLSETHGVAVMDHALEHIEVLAEKEQNERGTPIVTWQAGDPGEPSRACALDDHDRPQLRIKPHDWELGGFISVVKRNKEDALEKREVTVCLRDGQYMWDWAEALDLKRHEALTVGVVDVEKIVTSALETVPGVKKRKAG